MLRRLALSVLGLLLVFAAPAARAADDFDLNGDWVGTVAFDNDALSPADLPAKGLSYRLEFHDGVAMARVKTADGTWSEFCRDACHVDQKYSNAVIYGIHAAEPGAEGVYWVETWSFNVVLRDKDHMIVEFTRLVRNVGIEKSEGDLRPVFVMRGSGVFERTQPLPEPAPPEAPPAAAPPPKGGDI